MLLGAARAHRRLVGIRSRSAFEKEKLKLLFLSLS
jgi:hypothetical protein